MDASNERRGRAPGNDPAGRAPASIRSRLWAVPVAVLLAALGAIVAPGSWPTGEGTLTVEIDEHVVLQRQVTVAASDSARSQTLTGGG